MTKMETITILFKEYDTLRSELVGRITYWYQLAALALLAFGWLVQRDIWADKVTIIAVFLLVVLGTAFVFLLARDMRLLGQRLMELEAQINEVAGEELLKWETLFGTQSIWRYLWIRGSK